MELEFDVKINSKILYDYMLHHTYTSLSGILGTLVGFLVLVAYAKYQIMIYLIAGLVLLLYMPWTLFLKSKQQALNNPAFKGILHYKLTEEGLLVSLGDEVAMQTWDQMYKAVSTRKSLILYTSKINATIFPRQDMKELTPKVIEMISTHMPPRKVNIRY